MEKDNIEEQLDDLFGKGLSDLPTDGYFGFVVDMGDVPLIDGYGVVY